MGYEKGKLVTEGKTKKIFEVVDSKGQLVIVENKEDITAFDDSSKTRTFKTKSVFATTTTCRVFELLSKAGIPIAYQEQISPIEFVALNCKMIKLEVVARRFAVGSYLKRNPQLKRPEEQPPYRFHRLVAEFFLKTTEGKFIHSHGETLIEGLDPQKGEEDPIISNPFEGEWQLFHSKKPAWDKTANLKRTIKDYQVVPESDTVTVRDRVEMMENILRKVFLVLEGAWNNLGLHFIDLKIEFGIDPFGNLVVADVIDNDSWRLRDQNWQELSKEAFRQDEELTEVEKKYGIVANLVEQFRIPQQVFVFWRGSKKDDLPNLSLATIGAHVEDVVLSGHKNTKACLQKLEELMANYPEGGVILTKVGRSNGLGPILAAHTTWPVISIPATLKEFPHDLWSSIRMPSAVPLLTNWPEDNAILAAVGILAQKNPLLYAKLQEQIEELDT
jgi:phosphoribosylaminoimidazole-succinocarboxamide synthase/phosphoribosylcarboxyaminoimidazole (NCAIR) mutase